MNSKMGRPSLPNGVAKDVQVAVRLNPKQRKTIEKETMRTGHTTAGMIRDAAVAEALSPRPWVKSRWTIDDLEGKKVQFKLSAPKFWVEGVGEFLVRKNPRGELAIEICSIKAVTPYEAIETRFWIGQEAADRIELNPDPNVAPFRLLG